MAADADRASGLTPAFLPGGLWADAREPIRTLLLRPVEEQDQAFLLDTRTGLAPATRASRLLARCVEEGWQHLVPALTVGDREALLLQLRRLTLGDDMECLVSCPAPDCGTLLQVELDVRDVLLPAYSDVRREYELTAGREGATVPVRFRLPQAADLDRASDIASLDPERAATELLEACVREVSGAADLSLRGVDDQAVEAIEQKMAELDPQAEIELDLSCSQCSQPFSVVLDAGAFLLQELDERAEQLLVDVHTLALYYHWSESDIMTMPAARRLRYLDLLGAGERDTTAAAP